LSTGTDKKKESRCRLKYTPAGIPLTYYYFETMGRANNLAAPELPDIIVNRSGQVIANLPSTPPCLAALKMRMNYFS